MPFFAVLNVTTHPSTASVPITVLLYGLLLCGFNVAIRGLNETSVAASGRITRQCVLTSVQSN